MGFWTVISAFLGVGGLMFLLGLLCFHPAFPRRASPRHTSLHSARPDTGPHPILPSGRPGLQDGRRMAQRRLGQGLEVDR